MLRCPGTKNFLATDPRIVFSQIWSQCTRTLRFGCSFEIDVKVELDLADGSQMTPESTCNTVKQGFFAFSIILSQS